MFPPRVGSVADGRGRDSLEDVLLYGEGHRLRACSGEHANATRHQHDGAGWVDKVWCQSIGVCGAGEECYWQRLVGVVF